MYDELFAAMDNYRDIKKNRERSYDDYDPHNYLRDRFKKDIEAARKRLDEAFKPIVAATFATSGKT